MLEQIVGGHARLDDESLRPLFIRIARHLWELLEEGWRPRTDISDMIEWDPREFKTVADHCANVALDLNDEWADDRDVALKATKEQGTNIRLCIDGARRGDGSGSCGLAIYAYRKAEYQLLSECAMRREHRRPLAL